MRLGHRRHSSTSEPRLELTPLLDVIFLLLTFFIYSVVVSVRAQVLPVHLPSGATGEMAADVKIAAINFDQAGKLFLNRNPVTMVELERQLKAMHGADDATQFLLFIDSRQGQTDRGPVVVDLLQMFRRLRISPQIAVDPNSAPPQDDQP